jgi:hypothetical protein
MTGRVHLSAGRKERAKAARLEALPPEEGGNRVRLHQRAGRLGRLRGRGPVGRGGVAGWKKKEWAAAGPKVEGNYFRIKFEILNIQRLWKFAQGDLGGILT